MQPRRLACLLSYKTGQHKSVLSGFGIIRALNKQSASQYSPNYSRTKWRTKTAAWKWTRERETFTVVKGNLPYPMIWSICSGGHRGLGLWQGWGECSDPWRQHKHVNTLEIPCCLLFTRSCCRCLGCAVSFKCYQSTRHLYRRRLCLRNRKETFIFIYCVPALCPLLLH